MKRKLSNYCYKLKINLSLFFLSLSGHGMQICISLYAIFMNNVLFFNLSQNFLKGIILILLMPAQFISYSSLDKHKVTILETQVNKN